MIPVIGKSQQSSLLWIVGLCVIGVAAFVLMSGIFDKEKMIKVPELSTSQTQQEAIQTLTSSGFKKDNITIKQELSDDVEKGHVNPCITGYRRGNW